MKSIFKDENKLLKLFLFSGIGLRILIFIVNLFIGGHNSDEVMITLNAASLADNLTDIAGEKLPVYFDTWVIGGQSPLPTYLTALSVKLLGNNLFAVRLPALIFSILGFVALFYFAKEVFENSNHRLAFVGLGAISPWMLYSAAYVLDCNYLGHLLMFALLFFAKAFKENKTGYYIVSMTFFALCFYCYVASVLLIPFLLLALYLVLIIKKKISFKNVFLSVLTVAVVATPFVLWGLVVTGIIPEFKLLGFSFSRMEGYIRANDTVFASGGILGTVTGLFTNLISSLLMLILNDWSAFALGSNLFGYGFLLSGIITAFGLIKLIFAALKKDNDLPFTVKLFSASFVIGMVAFCSFVNDPHLGSLYRYGILSYMLIFIEAIGFTEIAGMRKKFDLKKVLSVYLALSFTFFTGVFVFAYIPQVYTTSQASLEQENFGDPFFKAMDFAEENGYENITVYKSKKIMMNSAAYERYYYYGEKEFYNIEDEIIKKNTHKDENGNYLVTTDGSLTYMWIDENNNISEDFCIIESENLDKVNFDSTIYKEKSFGYFSVIYK